MSMCLLKANTENQHLLFYAQTLEFRIAENGMEFLHKKIWNNFRSG